MSDLIEHFKLDAQIQADHTVHTEYVSDPRRGMRKVRVEEKWFRQRRIGDGDFGEVWLEVQRDRKQVVAERAVKSIQKRRMEGLNIDYKRELLALAKLSRVGVMDSSMSLFKLTQKTASGALCEPAWLV